MVQGREATTVRQAILVIVLVGASFLGGAFVNGPGLHWAQTRMLRSLGLSNGGEIASVDLKATANTETMPDGLGPAKVAVDMMQGLPAAVPSVVAEDESSKHNASDHSLSFSFQPQPQPQPEPKSKHGGVGSPPSPPSTASSPSPPRLSAAVTKISAGASLDPHVAPAILDSLAALLPSTPPVSSAPSPSSSRSPSAPKSVGDGGDDWAILERKMQTLGVSRFMIEAEPGGRVVFSCLIPLAGRQAIAQRFEAEGDDIVQAAHTALRRIGLWRASQALSK
jgi:hypothetical protein